MSNHEKGFENINDVSIQEVKVFGQGGLFLDIASSVLDLDIFEHIEKPYLTAVMGYADFGGVNDFLSIKGGERVEINLCSTHEDHEDIKKIFYIDKIISSQKIKENEEFYIAHMIEDIGFLSKTENINRSYSGSGSDIIEKVADEFFDRDLDVLSATGEDQQNLKLIIPNMNPIETISWIKNRLNTVQGFPFYLYSTLVNPYGCGPGKKLRPVLELADLNFLLTQAPMNPEQAFFYTESTATLTESQKMSIQQRRTILSYETQKTADVFGLLEKGLVGSEYNYLDVTKYKQNEFVFDIEEDVNDKFRYTDVIKESSNVDVLKYDWSASKNPKTKKITQIGGTSSYEDLISISESTDVARYKNKVTSMSMANLLVKDPININVNGYDFLDGKMNTSIGRKIRILFVKNRSDHDKTDDNNRLFDTSKSGDFLIYGCKHAIRQEGYTISMTLVKVSNDEDLEVPPETVA